MMTACAAAYWATCAFHLQTCCNFLTQLAGGLWITRFDSQLATSLLTSNNLQHIFRQQAVANHANEF